MNIPEIVKQLNIPLENCVVVSSGTLEILGIRKADDVDLAVKKELYDELFMDVRFEHVPCNLGGDNLRIIVNGKKVDVMPKLDWDEFPKTAEEVIKNSFQVDGVNFMSLNDLKEFKTALGREKDIKDLELIARYEN